MSDSFETSVSAIDPRTLGNSPVIFSARDAAAVSDNPDVMTNSEHLFGIVNTRIQAAAKKRLKRLERPFDGLICPATEEAKRAVLTRLATDHEFAVESGEDVDAAVVRW